MGISRHISTIFSREFVASTSGGNSQPAIMPPNQHVQEYIHPREVTAKIAMSLLQMPRIPNIPLTDTDKENERLFMNFVYDSKYQLSFEEFSSHGLKEKFYQFFLDMPVVPENPSGGVMKVIHKTRNFMFEQFPDTGFWLTFARKNPGLYANISTFATENSPESHGNIDVDLYNAYKIMLSYAEVKSNRMLFERPINRY